MLITDINTAGTSGLEIASSSDFMQILVNGTWNGGTVEIEKYVLGANAWFAIASFTANDYYLIETLGGGRFRTKTTHGGSAPVLTCDVTFESQNHGKIEAV